MKSQFQPLHCCSYVTQVEGMNMGFLLLAFNQISNNCGMLHYTSGGQFKTPLVIRGPGGLWVHGYKCLHACMYVQVQVAFSFQTPSCVATCCLAMSAVQHAGTVECR